MYLITFTIGSTNKYIDVTIMVPATAVDNNEIWSPCGTEPVGRTKVCVPLMTYVAPMNRPTMRKYFRIMRPLFTDLSSIEPHCPQTASVPSSRTPPESSSCVTELGLGVLFALPPSPVAQRDPGTA